MFYSQFNSRYTLRAVESGLDWNSGSGRGNIFKTGFLQVIQAIMKFLLVSWCNIEKTSSLISTVGLIEESFKPHIFVFSYQKLFQSETCRRGANSTNGRLVQRYKKHLLFQPISSSKGNSLKSKGHEMWKMLLYFWYRLLSLHDFTYLDEFWHVNSPANRK